MHCSTYDDVMSLTLGNIGVVTCSQCDEFNTTWLLDRLVDNLCVWQTRGVLGCSSYYGGPYSTTISYRITAHITEGLGGVRIWYAILEYWYSGWPLLMPGETFQWKWENTGPGAIDCTAQRTLTFLSYYSPTAYVPWLGDRICHYTSTPTCVLN